MYVQNTVASKSVLVKLADDGFVRHDLVDVPVRPGPAHGALGQEVGEQGDVGSKFLKIECACLYDFLTITSL